MDNSTMETLFAHFLESGHADSPLLSEMHRLSALIDQQIAGGRVDEDTIGEYELACCRFAFAGGYAAGVQAAGVNPLLRGA